MDQKSNIFKSLFSPEKLSIFFIFLVLVLAPLCFFPFSVIPFAVGKNALIYSGITLSLIFYLVNLLKKGKLPVSYEYVFLTLGGLLLVYLVSALLSVSPWTGMFGDMIGAQNFMFLFIMIIMLLLVFIEFREKNRVFNSYLVFFVVAIVMIVYQILKLMIGGDILSFGTLVSPTSNPVGSWNDFGVVMAVVVLLSLVTLEMFPVNKILRACLYVCLIASLLFLILVNSSLLWVLLGLFSLLFFVYVFSLDRVKKNEDVSGGKKGKVATYAMSLIILVISIIFLMSPTFGAYISSFAGTYQAEVVPTYRTVFSVAQQSVKEYPLFGVGPNQYDVQWLKHKPSSVNQSPFWYLEFNNGGGYILTSIVTVGILGFVLWLLFLGFFVRLGFRSVFGNINNYGTRYLVTSSFIVALFLWIVALFSSPGSVIVMLAFFFTGLFLAASARAGIIVSKTCNLFTKSRTSFISVMVLVLLLVVLGVFEYVVCRVAFASADFQKGIIIFNTTGNFSEAEMRIGKAIQKYGSDEYYRTLAELNQIEFNRLLTMSTEEMTTEDIQRSIQLVLTKAIGNAQMAVDIDSSEYRNWMTSGQIHHSLVSLEVQGAYEKASKDYEEALKRNPSSPSIVLTRAQLERTNGDNDGARDFIAQALSMKNNYTDARFMLAQIAVQENNVSQAIQSLNAASVLDPNNSALFFQLGILYYNTQDWSNAISTLNRAVELAGGQFGNARYFLGLSLAESDDRSGALEQFKMLAETNPTNEEVKKILSNLKYGRRALYGITEEPVEREELPVDEEGEEAELIEATSTEPGV